MVRQSAVFKKILLSLCVCSVLLCVTSFAFAETVRLSLVQAINIALENNEDVEESFRRIASAKADVLASEGAYDTYVFADSRYGTFPGLTEDAYEPSQLGNAAKNYFKTDVGVRQRISTGANIRAFYTYSHEERLGTFNQDKHFNKSYLTVELVQSLLRGFGDKETRGAIEAALLAVEDSVEGRSLAVSQITLTVIRSYWALAMAQNNLEVGKKVLAMAQEVLRRERVRHNKGISQGVDVERAELAVKQREYTVVQYERDVKTAQDYLLLLLNSPQLTSYMTIVPSSPPLKGGVTIPNEKEAMDLALSRRYELKQAAIVLKQLHIEYDVNSNKLLPSLDVVVGATTSHGNEYIRSAEGFSDTGQAASAYAGITFSYPLQNREARGSVQKTKELLKIAQERMNKTRRTIETEIKGILHNFAVAKAGIPLAEEAYTLAKSVVQGEQKRFEMGGINNRDLLAAHDAMGREEMSTYAAHINYNVALAEYRFACATILQKYGIVVTDNGASIP